MDDNIIKFNIKCICLNKRTKKVELVFNIKYFLFLLKF